MHLFENHGDVYLEFGGHDEYRNIWFHCLRVSTPFCYGLVFMAHVKQKHNVIRGGRVQKQLAAIFLVTGSSQVCLPLHDAKQRLTSRQAKKQAVKSMADGYGIRQSRLVFGMLCEIRIGMRTGKRNPL